MLVLRVPPCECPECPHVRTLAVECLACSYKVVQGGTRPVNSINSRTSNLVLSNSAGIERNDRPTCAAQCHRRSTALWTRCDTYGRASAASLHGGLRRTATPHYQEGLGA